MDAQKYLKIAIVGVICIVGLVVGYGIYINDASRRHIEKMAAAQYTVLPVAGWTSSSPAYLTTISIDPFLVRADPR